MIMTQAFYHLSTPISFGEQHLSNGVIL